MLNPSFFKFGEYLPDCVQILGDDALRTFDLYQAAGNIIFRGRLPYLRHKIGVVQVEARKVHGDG